MEIFLYKQNILLQIMSSSSEYDLASHENSYESSPKIRSPTKKPSAKAVPRTAKVVAEDARQEKGGDHGKKGECRKPWIHREVQKICEKVPRTIEIKRCKTVVHYKTVCKKVKIEIQYPEVKDKKCTKRCDIGYCKPHCWWEDVCVGGNSEKDCRKKGCCKGRWVAERKRQICQDVKVDCHEDVCYIEQFVVVKTRCEYVEVELKVACFETESYIETVEVCDTVCEWKEKTFPDPDPKCPTC